MIPRRGDARRRAILERRYRPLPGETPADRRSFAQLSELGGPLRDPHGPSPAERVRAELEAKRARDG